MKLGKRKSVNLPGVATNLPMLIEKDINGGIPDEIELHYRFVCEKGSNVDEIKAVCGERGKSVDIIVKVEYQEGIQNFRDIVEKTEAIIIAIETWEWRFRRRKSS